MIGPGHYTPAFLYAYLKHAFKTPRQTGNYKGNVVSRSYFIRVVMFNIAQLLSLWSGLKMQLPGNGFYFALVSHRRKREIPNGFFFLLIPLGFVRPSILLLFLHGCSSMWLWRCCTMREFCK